MRKLLCIGASSRENIQDMTLTEVRQLLAELDIRPSKALGQNFLIDGNILRILIEQADLRSDESALEIGPGLGVLTVELVARARRVVAIEKDRRLCQYLRGQLDGVDLIEGDAVDVLEQADFQIDAPYKVVSNLPYNISTPILERLVERKDKPRAMILTVQREVAHRLAATPRHKDYGALTVFTQLWYHVTIAHIISPRCFYPAPKVDSAIVVHRAARPTSEAAQRRAVSRHRPSGLRPTPQDAAQAACVIRGRGRRVCRGLGCADGARRRTRGGTVDHSGQHPDAKRVKNNEFIPPRWPGQPAWA